MLCDAMLVIIPSCGDVGVARARRWRPSQAQQELMQARQDSLTFGNSIDSLTFGNSIKRLFNWHSCFAHFKLFHMIYSLQMFHSEARKLT